MPVNGDGTLRPYNAAEISAWNLETRGIRDGSNPEETYSPAGNGCSRKWLCDWTDRFDVIKHLVGEVSTYTSGPTTYLTRNMPQTHPEFTTWICVRARVTGHKFLNDDSTTGGIGNKIPVWDQAEITADYEQVPFRLLDDDGISTEIDRYVTKPGRPGAEPQQVEQYVTMPGGVLTYVTDSLARPHDIPVPYSIGYTEVAERIFAIWHRIPELMYDTGTPLWNRLVGDPLGGTPPWRGTVNNTVLFGRPKYTCLLETVDAKLLPDPVGSSYSWTIKYQWLYKPQTHYRLIFFDTADSPVPISYHPVAKDISVSADPDAWGDGDSLFPSRDHADGLFKIN